MITFFGLGSRSAGKVRGMQVSNSLKSNFYDFNNIPSNANISKYVIFVRNRPSNGIEKELRRRGHIVGFDIIDNPVGDLLFRKIDPHMKNYVDDNSFDFYITNSKNNTAELKGYTENPIFTIPHHNCNFLNERTCFGTQIKKVGYLGLPEQNPYSEEIDYFCKEIGLEYVCKNLKSRTECVDFLKTIHLGINFIGKKRIEGAGVIFENKENLAQDTIRKYKPCTKILNFQSFGIPSISSTYNSLDDFGGDSYMKVETLEEVKFQITKIVNDNSFRKNMSEKSYLNGKTYNIENIKNYYLEIPRYYQIK